MFSRVHVCVCVCLASTTFVLLQPCGFLPGGLGMCDANWFSSSFVVEYSLGFLCITLQRISFVFLFARVVLAAGNAGIFPRLSSFFVCYQLFGIATFYIDTFVAD